MVALVVSAPSAPWAVLVSRPPSRYRSLTAFAELLSVSPLVPATVTAVLPPPEAAIGAAIDTDTVPAGEEFSTHRSCPLPVNKVPGPLMVSVELFVAEFRIMPLLSVRPPAPIATVDVPVKRLRSALMVPVAVFEAAVVRLMLALAPVVPQVDASLSVM